MYSSADFGPCPNQSCLSNEICRGRTSGQINCDCQTPGTCSETTSTPWSCRTDIKCIVPVIVVPVVVGLLIIIVVVIVIVKVIHGREKLSTRVKENPSSNRNSDRRSTTVDVTYAYGNGLYKDADTMPVSIANVVSARLVTSIAYLVTGNLQVSYCDRMLPVVLQCYR